MELSKVLGVGILGCDDYNNSLKECSASDEIG
jgi:hypothetical protein